MTLERKFLSFWPDLVGPCTEKVSFVSGLHSTDRAQICNSPQHI